MCAAVPWHHVRAAVACLEDNGSSMDTSNLAAALAHDGLPELQPRRLPRCSTVSLQTELACPNLVVFSGGTAFNNVAGVCELPQLNSYRTIPPITWDGKAASSERLCSMFKSVWKSVLHCEGKAPSKCLKAAAATPAHTHKHTHTQTHTRGIATSHTQSPVWSRHGLSRGVTLSLCSNCYPVHLRPVLVVTP